MTSHHLTCARSWLLCQKWWSRIHPPSLSASLSPCDRSSTNASSNICCLCLAVFIPVGLARFKNESWHFLSGKVLKNRSSWPDICHDCSERRRVPVCLASRAKTRETSRTDIDNRADAQAWHSSTTLWNIAGEERRAIRPLSKEAKKFHSCSFMAVAELTKWRPGSPLAARNGIRGQKSMLFCLLMIGIESQVSQLLLCCLATYTSGRRLTFWPECCY